MSANGTRDNGYHEKEVFIVSATRTPIGSIGGSLSSLTAPQLASLAIRSALKQGGDLSGDKVQKVIIGQAVQAGAGQSAAKQALVGAGIPTTCRDALINQVCASGTQALIMATDKIRLNIYDCIVAAGMESMSNIPYYQKRPSNLPVYGSFKIEDGLELDGLTDSFNKCHMGQCAEHTAKLYAITREAQDEYAISSYQRAKKASEEGTLAKEITPVEVSGGRNKPSKLITEDEEYKKIDIDKVDKLRTVFASDGTGTITAANASTLSDGAAACLIMSSKALIDNNVTPLAKIISYGGSANDPIDFATAPSDAVKEVGFAINLAKMLLSLCFS